MDNPIDEGREVVIRTKAETMERLRAHRLEVHGTANLDELFDCATCAALERQVLDSLDIDEEAAMWKAPKTAAEAFEQGFDISTASGEHTDDVVDGHTLRRQGTLTLEDGKGHRIQIPYTSRFLFGEPTVID